MKKPFFSIVIPTYNRVHDLQFALFCLLQQNFSDFEIIISDNCSIDNTRDVIRKINHKRIHYFYNKKKVNFALNVKEAVRHAKGKYIFLHGDDDFIPFNDCLGNLYKEIIKYSPGYVRINYVSLALDKEHIFSYKVKKPFISNYFFSAGQNYKNVLSFITDSDPYFITGIIFKNTVPKQIKIIDSDPYPWVKILLFVVKKFGGLFIAKPQIVATWSRRRIKKTEDHHLFSLIHGKLNSENYFNFVKKKLNEEDYSQFLHAQLMLFYIQLLPVVKINVGNRKMLLLCTRMRQLDKTLNKDFYYWTRLFVALIFPSVVFKLLRDTYLYFYVRSSKVATNKELKLNLKQLEKTYLLSKENVLNIKESLFRFK